MTKISAVSTNKITCPVDRKRQSGRAKTRLSTNPQRSSSSLSLNKNGESPIAESTYPCESVEKEGGMEAKHMNVKSLTNPQSNPQMSGKVRPCERQVYTSEEIAKKTADAFLRMGFLKEARVERCWKCHMVHILEVLK